MLRPRSLLIMIGITLVVATLSLAIEKKVKRSTIPPTAPDRLSLDDFVLGVVCTLDSADPTVRLTPEQARTLLGKVPLVRRDLYAQTGLGRTEAGALFETVLTDAQETAIARDPVRRSSRVVDPETALASLTVLLQRRAQGG